MLVDVLPSALYLSGWRDETQCKGTASLTWGSSMAFKWLWLTPVGFAL
jgi:hypothetical protein